MKYSFIISRGSVFVCNFVDNPALENRTQKKNLKIGTFLEVNIFFLVLVVYSESNLFSRAGITKTPDKES